MHAKKAKELASLITHTLARDEELYFYRQLDIKDMYLLRLKIEKLVENKDVFLYYLENEKEPEVFIYRILYNMFKAAGRVFNKESKHYLLSNQGINVLIHVFPMYYKKGIENKTLTYSFFVQQFLSVNKEELEKAIKSFWRRHAKIKKILLNE